MAESSSEDLSAAGSCSVTTTTKVQHLSEMSEFSNSFGASNTVFDVTIKLQNEEYRAHKVVLSSASGYFRSMFTLGYRENKMNEVTLQETPDLNTPSFSTLLDFMYTGDLRLSVDTVPQILTCASYLQIKNAVKACVDFINHAYNEDQLALEDLIRISAMSADHGFYELQDITNRVLAGQFGELGDKEASLSYMTYENMSNLLDRVDLVVTSETEVLTTVISWLKQDWASRSTHTISLLGNVRLGLIPLPEIINIFEGPLCDVPECREIYVDLLKYYALGKKAFVSKILADKQNAIFTPRDCVKALVVFASTSTMFDEENNAMINLTDKLVIQDYNGCAIVAVNGDLYCATGLVCKSLSGRFMKYVKQEDDWKSLRPMSMQRSYCALIHFNGYIYAIGGRNNYHDYINQYIGEVGRYRISSGTWQEIARLPHVLFTVPSVILFQDRIIVSGCSRQSYMQYTHHCVMMFDPSTDIWHTLYADVLDNKSFNRLHVHVIDETLYLVACKKVTSKHGVSSPHWHSCREWCLKVYRCECDVAVSDTKQPSLTIVKSVDQKFIPETGMIAFRIGNDVYISFNSCAYKTRMRIAERQVNDVNLESYSALSAIDGYEIATFNLPRKLIKTNE